MTRPAFTLRTKADREAAARMCMNAPDRTQVEFREQRRTDEQNRKMWACLQDLTRQRPFHHGISMTPDLYKAMLMHALGHEMRFIPTIDGNGMFPLGLRSSRLTIPEMSDLIELAHMFAAREGVTLQSPPEAGEGLR